MFKVMKYKYIPSKKERKLLRLLCHISKNLYNSTLYVLRMEYFKTKKVISYYELNKILDCSIVTTYNVGWYFEDDLLEKRIQMKRRL